MSFLEINGYSIPVEINRANKGYNRLGKRGRSPTGQYRSNERYKKKKWDLRTTVKDYSTVEVLQNFIEGEGHYFNFDSSLKSSKGLQPNTSYNVIMNSSGSKYNGYISIDASGNISYNLGYTNDWTIMLWADIEASDFFAFYSSDFPAIIQTSTLNWNQYVLTSSGTEYFNASTETDDVDFSFIDMTNGILTLQDTASWDYDIDEMVVFPFEISSQMVSDFYSYSQAFSNLPELSINGDITNSREVTVIGETINQPFNQFRNSNGWQNNGQVLEFELIER